MLPIAAFRRKNKNRIRSDRFEMFTFIYIRGRLLTKRFIKLLMYCLIFIKFLNCHFLMAKSDNNSFNCCLWGFGTKMVYIRLPYKKC